MRTLMRRIFTGLPHIKNCNAYAITSQRERDLSASLR